MAIATFGSNSGWPRGKRCHCRKWVGFMRQGNRAARRNSSSSSNEFTNFVRGIGIPCRAARSYCVCFVGQQSLQCCAGRENVVVGEGLRVPRNRRHELIGARNQRRLLAEWTARAPSMNLTQPSASVSGFGHSCAGPQTDRNPGLS